MDSKRKNKTMEQNNYVVESDQDGVRIDKCLSMVFDELSRSFIQRIIKEEKITVNDVVCKANYKVKTGDRLSFCIEEPVEPEILAEDIPLDILYEDHDLIVVNKPKGMVVHPAPGHYTGTLVNALMYHCKDDLSGINGVMRPGIVHRIDMDTTGSILVCKNDFTHNAIAEQLKEHSITRKYVAIVNGVIKEENGTVDAAIGRHPVERKKMSVHAKSGKEAVTHYRVLKRFQKHTYIECVLETGRTHQIRVHMSSIGYPILGDEVYGRQKSAFKLQGQTLHAKTIGFIHPRTNEYLEFEAPLPDYFEQLLTNQNL